MDFIFNSISIFIPEEILIEIFKYCCNVKDLRLVNKAFLKASKHPMHWQFRLLHYFPSSQKFIQDEKIVRSKDLYHLYRDLTYLNQDVYKFIMEKIQYHIDYYESKINDGLLPLLPEYKPLCEYMVQYNNDFFHGYHSDDKDLYLYDIIEYPLDLKLVTWKFFLSQTDYFWDAKLKRILLNQDIKVVEWILSVHTIDLKLLNEIFSDLIELNRVDSLKYFYDKKIFVRRFNSEEFRYMIEYDSIEILDFFKSRDSSYIKSLLILDKNDTWLHRAIRYNRLRSCQWLVDNYQNNGLILLNQQCYYWAIDDGNYDIFAWLVSYKNIIGPPTMECVNLALTRCNIEILDLIKKEFQLLPTEYKSSDRDTIILTSERQTWITFNYICGRKKPKEKFAPRNAQMGTVGRIIWD